MGYKAMGQAKKAASSINKYLQKNKGKEILAFEDTVVPAWALDERNNFSQVMTEVCTQEN